MHWVEWDSSEVGGSDQAWFCRVPAIEVGNKLQGKEVGVLDPFVMQGVISFEQNPVPKRVVAVLSVKDFLYFPFLNPILSLQGQFIVTCTSWEVIFDCRFQFHDWENQM